MKNIRVEAETLVLILEEHFSLSTLRIIFWPGSTASKATLPQSLRPAKLAKSLWVSLLFI